MLEEYLMKKIKRIIDLLFLAIDQFQIYIKLIFFIFFNERYAHKQILHLRGSVFLRRILIDYFIKKFEDYPYFYWERYKIERQLGGPNFNHYLSQYSFKRKLWLKKNLNKLSDIEFIEEMIVTGSFGNIYYLYSLLLANQYKLKKKKKILIYIKNKITNNILFEYFKDHITIVDNLKSISDDELIINKLSCHLGSAMQIEGNYLTPALAQNIIIKKKNENNSKSLFSLKEKHNEEGKKFLKSLGLEENKWFVTLHIRDDSYRPFEKNENFRNADIDDYFPAIKKIIDAGGFVFRVGHPGMKKIPSTKGIYDYANSKKKSELLDVFLGAKSKFCIATSSGYYIIPSLFSVPVLMTNCPQHSVFFELNNYDLYLPKLFKDKNTNELLKLPKIFKSSHNSLFSENQYEKKGIKVLNNTKDEIALATNEMLEATINHSKLVSFSDLQISANNSIQSEFFNYSIRIL